jgi:hypothetical protein
MEIYDSDKRGKRFLAVFDDGDETYFGLEGGTTYIDIGNRDMRKNYLARHRVNEDWNDYKSAGALSRYILWGSSTDVHKNIASYKKRFGLL